MADKGYKAFSPGFYCEHEGNRKQYYENSVAEDIGANRCCQSGVMHYCETPLDTLDYYPLVDGEGRLTEFAEVEPLDRVYSDGNKRACRKLKIGAKLNLKNLISAQIGIVFQRTEIDSGKSIKEWVASKLAAFGDDSQLAASGDDSQLAAPGYASKLAASGYDSKLAASGNASKLAASGNASKLAASGNASKLAASGDYSQLAASGDDSQLAASGENSIAAGIGRNNIAKAAMGSWIVLAEYGAYNGECYPIVNARAAQIDGEKLKADTWYKLKNGEFTEVTDD